MPVLCDHGNPTIGSCDDCTAQRSTITARDPGRKVTERWLEDSDTRTLVEAHLYYQSLGSRGADRASRCLSAVLRRYESESVPAEVREWCAAQADAAEKRHEEQERPTPPATPCESCGKPKTTSLFRDGDAPHYLCDSCYRAEWVCDECGLTLDAPRAACAECATTTTTTPHQPGASDNPNHHERTPAEGFFEATASLPSPLAPGAPTAEPAPPPHGESGPVIPGEATSNPAAPEDAPSVPSPAPPSPPPTPEGDEPDGAAGVGPLLRQGTCSMCNRPFADTFCVPGKCCVWVEVVIDREAADAVAALHDAKAELAEADQRADRAEDRAERLQTAVENLGRALVKERQSNPSRMRQSVSMGSDTIPHPAPLDLSDLFSDDPSEPPADDIPKVLARAFGETTGGAVFGPPSPDPAAIALSSLPIAHQLDLAMTGLQQSFSALRLLRDWLDTANRAIAMGEHCGQPFCSRNDYHTHEPPIVDAGPVRASPRMHL